MDTVKQANLDLLIELQRHLEQADRLRESFKNLMRLASERAEPQDTNPTRKEHRKAVANA